MLDLGFIEDVEKILRMCPSGRQTGALLGDDAGRRSRASPSSYMYEPVTIKVTPEAAHRRRDRAGLRRGRAAQQDRAPDRGAEGRGARAGDHLLPHQDRRRAPRPRAPRQGLSQQGPARRHEPGPARRGDDPVQGAGDAAAGRHRRRRARPRHRARHPRDQLRRAQLAPRSTCTGSAAPGGSGAPAGRSPSSPPSSATRSRGSSARRRPSIGEWEPPEERIEHAPRPRRRDHARRARAAASRATDGAGNGAVKLFVNRGTRSGIGEKELRWALTEGAVIPDERDRLDPRARALLVRRAPRRAGEGRARAPRRDQARGQADPGRVREGLAAWPRRARRRRRRSSCSLAAARRAPT